MRPQRCAVIQLLLLLSFHDEPRDGSASVSAFSTVYPFGGKARTVSVESPGRCGDTARRDPVVFGHESQFRTAVPQSLALAASVPAGKDKDDVIDAIIESRAGDGEDEPSAQRYKFVRAPKEPPRRRKRDTFREALCNLASLSLEDYEWRSNLFKSTEADRMVETSVARMMGEDPSYVRPMDASETKRGPLGKAEKDLVEWLSAVIEEEGRRARRVIDSDGDLVRPMEVEDGGPLAELERGVVSFIESIQDAERERWETRTVRPKDLEEGRRGPLGEAEAKAVAALKEIEASERIRMAQSRSRGGELVRPIDVPGPLGEVEMKVLDLIEAEKQRVKDRDQNDGKLVRPMDASLSSPLGEAERQASEVFKRLKEEEKERLYNIKRMLEEKRPMERDRLSLLGVTEALTVGLFRAPKLFMKVVDRVKELANSEKLDNEVDEERLRQLTPSLNTTFFEDIDEGVGRSL